ncbi:hypothetical protein GGR56DRAFT_313422 [Xylariaceae sp. FL0804]|nr:hypothetical protein GGR56DRAFT_313422 [Xylariaceae sp. FL0804]
MPPERVALLQAIASTTSLISWAGGLQDVPAEVGHCLGVARLLCVDTQDLIGLCDEKSQTVGLDLHGLLGMSYRNIIRHLEDVNSILLKYKALETEHNTAQSTITWQTADTKAAMERLPDLQELHASILKQMESLRGSHSASGTTTVTTSPTSSERLFEEFNHIGPLLDEGRGMSPVSSATSSLRSPSLSSKHSTTNGQAVYSLPERTLSASKRDRSGGPASTRDLEGLYRHDSAPTGNPYVVPGLPQRLASSPAYNAPSKPQDAIVNPESGSGLRNLFRTPAPLSPPAQQRRAPMQPQVQAFPLYGAALKSHTEPVPVVAESNAGLQALFQAPVRLGARLPPGPSHPAGADHERRRPSRVSAASSTSSIRSQSPPNASCPSSCYYDGSGPDGLQVLPLQLSHKTLLPTYPQSRAAQVLRHTSPAALKEKDQGRRLTGLSQLFLRREGKTGFSRTSIYELADTSLLASALPVPVQHTHTDTSATTDSSLPDVPPGRTTSSTDQHQQHQPLTAAETEEDVPAAFTWPALPVASGSDSIGPPAANPRSNLPRRDGSLSDAWQQRTQLLQIEDVDGHLRRRRRPPRLLPAAASGEGGTGRRWTGQ